MLTLISSWFCICLVLFVQDSFCFIVPISIRSLTHRICRGRPNVLSPSHHMGLCLGQFSDSLHQSVSEGLVELKPELRAYFDQVINDNKVVLFMKGNRLFPSCGFSNRACRILEALNVEFTTVNVLDNSDIREGVKQYSNWPTIPQLYINREFIGGSDIMLELYENGELKSLLAN